MAYITINRVKPWLLYMFVCAVALHIRSCAGHGRLIEPPSRASAWRYGFQTPPDYNDHELYCGGFTRQWKRNGGKCGECGDAYDMPLPRPHEFGGQWGSGLIVRKYQPGTDIIIRIELTASHMGYFEFRLCPDPNAKQDCLDKHLLKVLGGSPAMPAETDLDTRFYPRNGSRIYEIKAQLPDIKCGQCVLQWRYIAGNNWGMCSDGNGAVGCGPQEEFRSCSDIALGEGAHTPIRPMRPTFLSTTQRPRNNHTSTESTTKDEIPSENITALILVIILTIILLLFAVAFWYLYSHKRDKFDKWRELAVSRLCKNKDKTKATNNSLNKTCNITSKTAVNNAGLISENGDKNMVLGPPPIPPPRTKRNSRIRELSPDESSIA